MRREVRERPILFSAPMVKAILSGAKVQTRRVIKPQPIQAIMSGPEWEAFKAATGIGLLPLESIEERRVGWTWKGCRSMPWPHAIRNRSPFGFPGTHLWVRETWAAPHDCDHLKPSEIPQGTRIHHRATWEGPSGLLWRPSIFMVPWMARLHLEVEKVRAEQLQEITETDILAEGVTVANVAEWCNYPWSSIPTLHDAWQILWDHINGERAPWSANPWVWCISFRRLTAAERAA